MSANFERIIGKQRNTEKAAILYTHASAKAKTQTQREDPTEAITKRRKGENRQEATAQNVAKAGTTRHHAEQNHTTRKRRPQRENTTTRAQLTVKQGATPGVEPKNGVQSRNWGIQRHSTTCMPQNVQRTIHTINEEQQT